MGRYREGAGAGDGETVRRGDGETGRNNTSPPSPPPAARVPGPVASVSPSPRLPVSPSSGRPIRVLIQGFGDVGGSLARLLTEESPDFDFRIAGVADEFGALYRAEGLDAAALLRLRAERRAVVEYEGPLDALWVGAPSEAQRARPEFR